MRVVGPMQQRLWLLLFKLFPRMSRVDAQDARAKGIRAYSVFHVHVTSDVEMPQGIHHQRSLPAKFHGNFDKA